MTQADVPRALAGGRQEDLRSARVGVLLEEVVLHLPHVVDAEAIGQLDLLERVRDQLLLCVLRPGARQLMLVEDPESHGCSLWSWEWWKANTLPASPRSGGMPSNSARRLPSGLRSAIDAIPSAMMRRPSSSTAPSSSSSRRMRSGRRLRAITPFQATHMNL